LQIALILRGLQIAQMKDEGRGDSSPFVFAMISLMAQIERRLQIAQI
jgi:hypothetical protein